MSGPVPVSQIADMLAARIEVLARELLPGGEAVAGEWRCGSLAGERGKRGGSLAVHIRQDGRAGVWSDFHTGECGDALDLVAEVLFRGDKREAVQWSLGWLGLDGSDPARLKATRRAVAAAKAAPVPEEGATAKLALRIWLGCREALRGSPAAAYLAGRGIDLAELGRQPRSLRWTPELWNREANRKMPALVAGIVDGAGATIAVHRTWLAPDGRGGWKKAPLRDPKMTLGTYRGGAIRLWRGASGRRAGDKKADDVLAITEGIEDALSLALARPDLRIWAAVSLSNMGALVLPETVRTVIVCADNDAEGSRAAQGLERALRHLSTGGRRVRVARPPAAFKDFNELLQAGAAAAAPLGERARA